MQVAMLGSFEVRTGDGVPVDVPGARLRALLIALALEPGRVVQRATLIDWLWGERPPADPVNALHRLVSRLRKVLPAGLVEGRTEGYRLLVAPGDVDAVLFQRLVTQTSKDEALALWRGAAMQDVGLHDSAAFDAVVARLEGLRLTAVEDRFAAEACAEHVPELTDLVAAHPVRERLVAALMLALVAAGQPAEALLVYQRTREALADTLGIDPSPELSALHVALLRGEVGPRTPGHQTNPRGEVGPRTPGHPTNPRGEVGPRVQDRRTNVRAELTSFVGRDADVAAVRELVAGHRLTTLVGPGGAGKTRLATEVSRLLLDDLPDGAWLVELAPIGADGDLARATLAGFGLRDALLGEAQAGEADLTDRIVAAIRERETLLILDNCEHVIESAAAFAHRLLGECRRLRILATSREPLGITGEALWQVEPLALPGAVRLMRDRAEAVRRNLASDAPTLTTMARVCRALDGMPLAIELAAARLRTMSLDQLAHRLDDRFRLLTNGSRTAPPQHRTLRAVVDWSWELLTGAERTVLRRLAVFTGGASLAAAEQVCAGGTVGPEQVFELLTALTEKSLVVAGGDSVPRYRMLDTIRQYAAERLAEAGEPDSARRAHLAWFTELAETAEPHLRRAEQLEWLAVLTAEHDNLGAAMRGALAAGDAGAAARLAMGAGWYWWLGGHKAEGLELVRAAALLPGEVPDDVRAGVYGLVVHFLTSGRSGERESADWIHKAYRLSRDSRGGHPMLGFITALERVVREPAAFLPAFEALLDHEDPWVRALARLHLGKMRIVLGRPGRDADAYLETALAEFRAIGERFGISFALTQLADRVATRGEFAGACELYEQAATVVAEVGAAEDVIRLRARLAQLYWLLGDGPASAAALDEAQRYAVRVAWPDALAELTLAKAQLARLDGDTAEAYRQLGATTALLGGDADRPEFRATVEDLLGYLADHPDQAWEHRVAAFKAASETGYAPSVAVALVGIADLALRRGQYDQAARMLAVSDAVRGTPDLSHRDAVRIEQVTRHHLGEQRFAEVTREGGEADWRQLASVMLAS